MEAYRHILGKGIVEFAYLNTDDVWQISDYKTNEDSEYMAIHEIAAKLKKSRAQILRVESPLRLDSWCLIIEACDRIVEFRLATRQCTGRELNYVLSSLFAKGTVRSLYVNWLSDENVEQALRLICDYGKLEMLNLNFGMPFSSDYTIDCLVELFEKTKLTEFYNNRVVLHPAQGKRLAQAVMNSCYIRIAWIRLWGLNIDELKRHVSLREFICHPSERREVYRALNIARSDRSRIFGLLMWGINRGFIPKSYRDIFRLLAVMWGMEL